MQTQNTFKKMDLCVIMYMCGAAFDFHCLEILVGNVWNLWIFKLWINAYMYKENMWLKLYAMQWCVWMLVAERGFCFSLDVKEQRGSVWICDSPAAATTTDRTRTGSLFCRMAVLCHHIKILSVKNLVVLFSLQTQSARQGLKVPSIKRLRDSLKWPTSEMIWIFDKACDTNNGSIPFKKTWSRQYF